MSGARRGLLLAVLGLAITLGSAPGSGTAASPGPVPRQGVAIIFVLDQIPFEDALAVPELRALAATGGAGLMTTKVGSGDPGRSAYLTIGAGAHTPGSGTPYLMDAVLARRRLPVCVIGDGAAQGLGRLLATEPSGRVPCDFGPELFTTGGLPVQVAHFLAGSGGVLVVDLPAVVANGTPSGKFAVHQQLVAEGSWVRAYVEAAGSRRTLAMVVSPRPSPAMDRIGDEVMPLVLAEGIANRLLARSGPMHGLTSDSTRYDGLVSNVDIAPTVLRFFGLSIPREMDGEPIRVTDGAAPFALHRLHLEQRRIRLPIQLAEVAFVSALGIVGLILLFQLDRRGSLSPAVASVMRYLALCGGAFAILLFAGGLLPRLTYPVVVPFLVVCTLGLAALALLAGRSHWLRPFTFLGTVGLVVLVVDAAFGWRAARIPLLGGTMLDGVRYYGLPNSFIALLLGSAMFVAWELDPFPGFLLLFAAGLFAGFPRLGADIGGAATLFSAAGLWWVLRTRPRVRIQEAAFAVGVAAVGVGLVLLANRYLPGAPTHATRFVERAGGRLGSAAADAWRRLKIGFGQVGKTPPAIIPLVGLPAVLVATLRAEGPVGKAVRLVPAWRDVVVTLVAASIVAFFANDTGVAAAAPGFLYAMVALAYPAFTVAVANDAAPPVRTRSLTSQPG